MPPLHQQGRQHNLEIATCSAGGDLATLGSKRRIVHVLVMQSFDFSRFYNCTRKTMTVKNYTLKWI